MSRNPQSDTSGTGRSLRRTALRLSLRPLDKVNGADDVWEEQDHYAAAPDVAHGPAPAADGWLPGLRPADQPSQTALPLFTTIDAPPTIPVVPSAFPIDAPFVEEAGTIASLDDGLAEEPDDDATFSPAVSDFDLGDPGPEVALDPSTAQDSEEFFGDDFDTGGFVQSASDADAGRVAFYDDADVPDFDPAGHVAPWDLEVIDDEVSWRKARLKAAELAALLDVVTPAQRSAAAEYAAALYHRQPHGATRLALIQLAHEGLDFETLKAMVELREEWAARSEWWLHRHGGQTLRSDKCRTAMTWRLALKVCRARADYPAECMIDDDWVDEWFGLRPGESGYPQFAAFIAEKVDPNGSDALCEGLLRAPGDHHDEPGVADHHQSLHRATVGPMPVGIASTSRSGSGQ